MATCSNSRCFNVHRVTWSDLIQPTLNQTHSGGFSGAQRCNVCKSGLLSRAAFKGHVFAAMAPARCLQRAPPHSSRTCNSSVQNLSSHIFRSEVENRVVLPQVRPAASAPRGTVKFAASSRKTDRVGGAGFALTTGCDGEPALYKRAHVHAFRSPLPAPPATCEWSAVSRFCFCRTRRQLCYQHGISA